MSYAIALLTPDDVGNTALESTNLKLRARQNVVFEFGYFMGKLGRHNVVALVKDDVEIPSDYLGVLYIQIGDNDAWRYELIKELKAAGFDIDSNKAM